MALALSLSIVQDVKAASFVTAGSLNIARRYHTATVLPNGKVLVPGGFNAPDSPQASADIYDPSAGTWSSAGTMSSARAGHMAVHLQDGRILVMGGLDTPPGATASVDIYTE